MSVVDFGSGSGAYVLACAEAMGGGGHVYGVDIQRDLLRRLQNEATRRHLHNVHTIWADLEEKEATKIASHHVNRVIISNLLFQVPDKVAIFAEARRILKKDGQVAIVDWSETKHPTGARAGPHRDDIISEQRALELVEAAGFTLVRRFDAGTHHYGLLLQSKFK
jgi:ubiquinone/menaquinone biosynthesis C-methylase UbiE